jgi:NAD(P)H dehydrogenase (quinone)
MKVLVVFAHPVEDSFAAALRNSVVAGLTSAGHTVDLCDLYREDFDPRLSSSERLVYREPPANQAGVADHVRRLQQADGIIFVFPSWWYGMPAILKGYFDRVWLPGVAFTFGAQSIQPLLTGLRVFGVVTTTGAPEWFTRLYMGNPSRKVLMRGLSRLLPWGGVDRFWLALYGMDRSTPQQRARFLDKVQRRVGTIARR